MVRRLRSRSETPGRAGYAFVGSVGLLGLRSLATIGLALIILAAALAVVANRSEAPSICRAY